jgi:hypothetical protein
MPQEAGMMKEQEQDEEDVEESAEESLLSVEIPHVSLELSERFATDIC